MTQHERRGIDAVLNYAGLIRGGPLVELPPADLELVMAVNVLGTARVTTMFFPLLRRTFGVTA